MAEHVSQTTINGAEASHNAVAWDLSGQVVLRIYCQKSAKEIDLLLLHAKVNTVVFHKLIILSKRPCVEQQQNPLPGSQLALEEKRVNSENSKRKKEEKEKEADRSVLCIDSLGSSTKKGLGDLVFNSLLNGLASQKERRELEQKEERKEKKRKAHRSIRRDIRSGEHRSSREPLLVKEEKLFIFTFVFIFMFIFTKILLSL